ncbi:MAG: biotin-dependent carboxyltransferase family protein [Vicingaceae bacterium]
MIEVKKAGILSSLQDRGRFGYRDQGVPLSGAMDQYSAAFANQLLGNKADRAVLEFALQGPTLFFNEACKIVICGADWQVELNGNAIDLNTVIEVPDQSTLKCKGVKSGIYGYLAVQNGFREEKVLGSYSYYQGITSKAKIEKGQVLKFRDSYDTSQQHASVSFQADLIAASKLAVTKGPEFDQLNGELMELLFNREFIISKDSNRMAYTLNHELELSAEEITTAPVQPGTVQLTPSGKLVVLMRDAQTTGGYARILQLTPMGVNQLAQKRPGEKVSFQL